MSEQTSLRTLYEGRAAHARLHAEHEARKELTPEARVLLAIARLEAAQVRTNELLERLIGVTAAAAQVRRV